MKRVYIFLLALLFLNSCTSSSDTIYQITNVSIVNVEQGIIVPYQAVLIINDRIDQIDAQSELAIHKQAQVIDGSGLYLMPGLTDAHAHFLDAPVFGRLMLTNGVTLVRDTGLPNDYILEMRDQLNSGAVLGPEMIATGQILDGYPPLISSTSLGLKTPEEARQAVAAQAEAGVDMIKVYSKLEKDVFLAILEEAQKYDLKVIGHVPDSIYIEDAAAVGMKSSEHIFGFEKIIAKLLEEPVRLQYVGMGADIGYLLRLDEVDPLELQGAFQRLRDSGLTVCPTIVTFQKGVTTRAFQSGDFPQSEFVSPLILDTWQTLWAEQSDLPDFVWQQWAKMVALLNDAGVPLMVGTDLLTPGVLPGFSLHEEMQIWQQAGISPADILRSATIVPAQFMELDERLGTVSEGKSASLLLLRANPLDDISNTQQIESVFLRGKYFSRDDLDQLIQEAIDLAPQSTP